MSAFTAAPSAAELHLVYVLLDSNLPTGGFVSSSGLESYSKHGFLTSQPMYPSNSDRSSSTAEMKIKAPEGIMNFTAAELENYASTTLCFVADAWRAVDHTLQPATAMANSTAEPSQDSSLESEAEAEDEVRIDKAVRMLGNLDRNHESNLLSHVSRRSSKAQGVAMLTLYTRGLSRPPGSVASSTGEYDEGEAARSEIADAIVERYKRSVRKGDSPGHLSVCWGVMTAAMGLTLDRALHLHLFLHARSLLSASVRLNVVGPYASSQLLLHPMRQLIEDTLVRYNDQAKTSTGLLAVHDSDAQSLMGPSGDESDFWEWTHHSGPATTWPLGEILMGRHDLQHSRIFNS